MHKKLFILIILISMVFFPVCQKQEEQPRGGLEYPITEKVDQVDDYFGTQVADPYRWLEDDQAEDVKAWVQRQNELTFSYLENIPFRQKIRQRLNEVYDYMIIPDIQHRSELENIISFTRTTGCRINR